MQVQKFMSDRQL